MRSLEEGGRRRAAPWRAEGERGARRNREEEVRKDGGGTARKGRCGSWQGLRAGAPGTAAPMTCVQSRGLEEELQKKGSSNRNE